MSLNFCTYEATPKNAPPKSSPSSSSSGASSIEPKPKLHERDDTDISIMSWNIDPKVIAPSYYDKEKNIKNIKKYIKESKSDIIFTQESLIEDIDKTNYTTIQTHYIDKSGKSHSNALTIHILNSKFTIYNTMIRRSGYNMKQKKYEGIMMNPSHYDYGNSEYIRPILAIRVKNNSTKKNYILVNVWAPHSIDINNDYNEYIRNLKDIIATLYRDGDRIIITGDFNEFYAETKSNSIELILNFKKIPLYLMQKKNTHPNGVLDLLFDSEKNTKVVVVYQQGLSDHYPIIGIIKEKEKKAKKVKFTTSGGNRNLRSIVRSKLRSKLKNKLRNKTKKN